jgi:CrcB protein
VKKIVNILVVMNAYKLLLIGLGGACGSILRHVVAKAIHEKVGSVLPLGTLTVNVVGSFLLGLIYMLVARKVGLTENARLLLGVGFCGGFTTFSAFALENFHLMEQKMVSTSALYISISVAGGILALGAGIWVSRFF